MRNFLLFLSIIAFFSILIANVLMNYTVLGNKEKKGDKKATEVNSSKTNNVFNDLYKKYYWGNSELNEKK